MTDDYSSARDAAAEAYREFDGRRHWHSRDTKSFSDGYDHGYDQGRAELKEELYTWMLSWRDIEPEQVCKECGGAGLKAYPSTSLWRGGVGGQMICTAVCDKCWGSGNTEKPGVNLKRLERELAEAKEKSKLRADAMDAVLKGGNRALADALKEVERLTAILGTDRMDDWRRIQDAERKCERLERELQAEQQQTKRARESELHRRQQWENSLQENLKLTAENAELREKIKESL